MWVGCPDRDLVSSKLVSLTGTPVASHVGFSPCGEPRTVALTELGWAVLHSGYLGSVL